MGTVRKVGRQVRERTEREVRKRERGRDVMAGERMKREIAVRADGTSCLLLP